MQKNYTLYNGNCLEEMKNLPDPADEVFEEENSKTKTKQIDNLFEF